MLESSAGRFVSIVADGYRAVVDGGFVLPAANEPDDPMTLDQTVRFSVSVVNDKGDNELPDGRYEGDGWFDTVSSEHDTAPVVAGLRFTADDDGGGDVRFGGTVPCDAHTAGGVSGDTADAAAVDTGPPIDPNSASPFGARPSFALTFALIAIGTAFGLASVGTFAATDVSSCGIPVVAPEHSQFTAQAAANRFFKEEHGAFAEGDSQAEYCVPGAVYDPASVLSTSATDCWPFGTHLSAELGADERAGLAALLELHGGAHSPRHRAILRLRPNATFHFAMGLKGCACQLPSAALLG